MTEAKIIFLGVSSPLLERISEARDMIDLAQLTGNARAAQLHSQAMEANKTLRRAILSEAVVDEARFWEMFDDSIRVNGELRSHESTHPQTLRNIANRNPLW
jgi:hypothetical protein